MGQYVIDRSTGEQFEFSTDKQGYKEALECLERIEEQGHTVDSQFDKSRLEYGAGR